MQDNGKPIMEPKAPARRHAARPTARGLNETQAQQARHTVAAREAERRALAAELHDAVGTSLAAVKMNLSSIARALSPGALDEMQLLVDTQSLLADTIQNVRDLCNGLHPAQLDHAGLPSALATHCARLSRRTGLAIEVDLGAGKPRFSAEIELMLMRVAQEALWNSVKHANATLVRITYCEDGARRRFAIQDNGIGFDATLPAVEGGSQGIGIPSMRERTLCVAARFTLSSSPGKGTLVEIDF